MLFADECGVYLLPMVRQTWAPRGETPVLYEHCGYEHLSIAAAISSAGNIVFWCRKSSFKGFECAVFLDYVATCYRNHGLILIWDGATIHKSKEVKEFLAEKTRQNSTRTFARLQPGIEPHRIALGISKKENGQRGFPKLGSTL